MRYLIVIPAFDEVGTIAEVVAGARQYGPVLVVDDGSSDGTAVALEAELLVAAARAGRPILEVGLDVGRPPVRPSRFHALADGLAIGAYLALQVGRRGARELGDAVREIARLFERARRRARHAEMAAAGARYPGA